MSRKSRMKRRCMKRSLHHWGSRISYNDKGSRSGEVSLMPWSLCTSWCTMHILVICIQKDTLKLEQMQQVRSSGERREPILCGKFDSYRGGEQRNTVMWLPSTDDTDDTSTDNATGTLSLRSGFPGRTARTKIMNWFYSGMLPLFKSHLVYLQAGEWTSVIQEHPFSSFCLYITYILGSTELV